MVAPYWVGMRCWAGTETGPYVQHMSPKKLKNGMRVHLVPMKGTDAATVLVLTKVGSRYESDKVWGGSHFIEHLMFKGTKRRPKSIDITKTIDRYGAEYNAYTGKDLTGYYIRIDAEQIAVAVDVLHDMVFHSTFDAKEMAKEKKVIIEEIKMYQENPMIHLEDLVEEAMFPGSTLGRDIGGTQKSMTDMKRRDVIDYRDAYYVPSRVVIVVSGNIPKNILSLLEKTFGRVKKQKEPVNFRPFVEVPQPGTPRIRRQYKPLTQIQLGFGFPTVGADHTDQPAIQLLANVLGGTMSSRLFTEVRERRALAYDVRAKADTYEDIGVFLIRAGLDAARLSLASKTILDELEKVKRHGITKEELQTAKDNVEGGMKLSLENSSDRAEFYGRQELFFTRVLSPELFVKKIHAVTQADVKRVARDVLQLSKLSIGVIGPYKTDAALLKHLGKLQVAS